jgi:hypothetical protein
MKVSYELIMKDGSKHVGFVEHWDDTYATALRDVQRISGRGSSCDIASITLEVVEPDVTIKLTDREREALARQLPLLGRLPDGPLRSAIVKIRDATISEEKG